MTQQETHWYHYRQNNSGGSFLVDRERGTSVNVYIEAESAYHADHRAETIGLYFGGEGDCDCCGDRWYTASDYQIVTTPPEKGEPLVRDDNDENNWVTKWTDAGEAESYIHPLVGPFYSAHTEYIRVEREFKGYAVRVPRDGSAPSDVFPSDGIAPDSGYSVQRLYQYTVATSDTCHIFWAKNKSDLERVHKNVQGLPADFHLALAVV